MLGILLIVVLAINLGLGLKSKPTAIVSSTALPTSAQMGEVLVEVTPEKLGLNEEENIFDLKFNTHSVNLDFDFSKIIILTDNLGNTYRAISWSGGQGGHHLEGRIVFSKLKIGGQKVTLKITQIGGGERSFSWELYQR